MGRRIFILTVFSLVLALSGRDVLEYDVPMNDSCMAFNLESSYKSAHGGAVSAFYIPTITSGINTAGSLKNHKHNILCSSRRFFQNHDLFLRQGKFFHHPISNVNDPIRRVAALMKFLI